MLLRQLVATIGALTQSIKYGRTLGIRRGEWKRYLKKSASLGLCYAGFGVTGSGRESWGAGRAAFLCCVYDVVTDWRKFDESARIVFEEIMRSMRLEPGLQSLALDLYDKELLNELEEDGLDRGYIALRFTLRLMGCEKAREGLWPNVDEIGRLFQIVDDVLDYEQDVASGEMNCLNSIRRDEYLRQLIEKFAPSETQRLLGKTRSVLIIAIERARKRAEELLIANNSVQEPNQTSPAGLPSSISFDIR
jgi:hypothetical protein